MSDPSDPPPSPSEQLPEEPPPMTVLAALAWSFGVTFALYLLHALLMMMKPGSGDDVVRDGFCQVVAYLGGLFLILRVHAPEASIRDFIGLRRTHLAFYPVGLLLGMALWLPADLILTLIEKRWPLPAGGRVAEQIAHASTPRKVAMIATMALAGPIVEEVIFRGAIFRALRKNYAPIVVIAVTAGLFAMVHGAFQIFVPIMIIGLTLGLLRSESGSLVPGVLLHAGFNGMTCALLLYTKPAETNVNVPDALVGASAGIAAMLIGFVRLIGARSAIAGAAREMDRR